MRTVAALCRQLTADTRHDGELLAAFTSGASEAAFTELVRRHGPLVWGTCRRLLPDPADAEDAFQAAFLVLVRRSGQLRQYPCVGPWLHRVAVWTARNVRRKNARRLARQTALPDRDSAPAAAPAPDPDLKADLDAALLALPARYRDPIVLCHLLGFTRREAAERLGCPEGTLSGWLNRGLAKLRVRLRGLDPTTALAGGAVAVPMALGASTARAAAATAVAASVPPTVSVLVEGVLHMLWVKKATAATVALCAVFAMGVGIGLGVRTEHTGAIAQDKKPTDPKPITEPKPKASAADHAKAIAELETAIRNAEAARMAALEGEKTAKARVDVTRVKGDLKDLQDDLKTLARFQENAAQAEAQLKVLKEKIANLKATGARAQPPAKAVELRELEARLEEVKAQLAALEAEATVARHQAEEIAARADQLRNQAVELQRQKEVLMKRAAAAVPNTGVHLELRIVVTPFPQCEFALKETDAAGKVIGTATTREPAMLAKLLARAKKDSTAPKELRVIADPQSATTGYTASVLKACEAAGYATVTFTGYVFQGGEATPLKPNQTGNVPGYKRYNESERKPGDLAKEIEEGLKRL